MEQERITVLDLAEDLRVRKQRLFKIVEKLGIRTAKRREPARGGQVVATVTPAEADRIRQWLSQPGSHRQIDRASEHDELPTYAAGDELGVFYVVQLEPQHDPARFKVGFTSDLESRLRKHRTSAPFARCEKNWPCRRNWERAAIDCVTNGCEQLHIEVFRASCLADVIRRADEFFSIMPRLDRKTVRNR